MSKSQIASICKQVQYILEHGSPRICRSLTWYIKFLSVAVSASRAVDRSQSADTPKRGRALIQ